MGNRNSSAFVNVAPLFGKRQIIWAGVIIVAVFAAALPFGQFRYAMICTRCGAMREVTDWQIPRTRITLFSTSSERQTPVSAELLHGGIMTRHEHQWLFAQGGGNGVRCAIDDGRFIRGTAESAAVATILAACRRYEERQFRDRLLPLMFDPQTSSVIYGLGNDLPKSGFTNAAQLHAWIGDATATLDELIPLYQRKTN